MIILIGRSYIAVNMGYRKTSEKEAFEMPNGKIDEDFSLIWLKEKKRKNTVWTQFWLLFMDFSILNAKKVFVDELISSAASQSIFFFLVAFD